MHRHGQLTRAWAHEACKMIPSMQPYGHLNPSPPLPAICSQPGGRVDGGRLSALIREKFASSLWHGGAWRERRQPIAGYSSPGASQAARFRSVGALERKSKAAQMLPSQAPPGTASHHRAPFPPETLQAAPDALPRRRFGNRRGLPHFRAPLLPRTVFHPNLRALPFYFHPHQRGRYRRFPFSCSSS